MFKVTGENVYTGNTWECVTDIATYAEAVEIRKGWTRLESVSHIAYRVDEYGTPAPAERPVHVAWDGRNSCNGQYGGPAVNPKHDGHRVTCPECRELI